MTLNPVLSAGHIARLRCPTCAGALRQAGEQLDCLGGHRFAVRDNVPVLLDPATERAIEATRAGAENVRLRRSFNKTLLRAIDFVRPPHPAAFMRWKVCRPNRAAFSGVVARNRAADDALFLDIGSGILGGKNASGLSAFVRERVVALEIDTTEGIGVVGDAHNLPWQDNSVDGVLIQGVLEHVRDPEQVVAEIHRVLKPGAPVYADVPFQQHYHNDPLDFRRWTEYGFVHMFGRFAKLDSGVCAGPATALTDMLTEFPAVLFSRPSVYWAVKAAFGWVFSPLQLLDAFWAGRPRAHTIAAAVYFLGVKQ